MQSNPSRKHLIDILFVLSLFLVFSVCSVTLILFGADVYKKQVSHMENNYESRTSIAYFFEKIRQNDTIDSISVTTKGDSKALKFITNIEGTDYAICLYEYDGYLYELFTRADIELSPESGQKIMEISNLNFEQVTPSLFNISFINQENEVISLYINSHCQQID